MRSLVRGLFVSLILAGTLVPAQHLRAEQFQQFDDYLVYYNALTTAELNADVAKQYGIVQSSHSGLLNIAVQKKSDAPLPQTVAATIAGKAAPLVGDATTIRFREIKEEDGTVYYLGEFAVGSPGTYRISLSITPAGRSQSYNLKFNKEYVGD